MEDSDNILLAVGCVFLVTWYGVTRFALHGQEVRAEAVRRRAEQRAKARAAFAAEFQERGAVETVFPGGTVACEHCGATYPAGVMYCECGGECEEVEEPEESMDTMPGEEPDGVEFTTEQELVCIHVAENHWKATLLMGFLNSHDIPCATRGTTSSGPYQFKFGPMSEVKIYVLRQHAVIAERLLTTIKPQESFGEREE